MMIMLFNPDPVHSSNIDDAETSGVVVELDQETAEREGVFEETALTEQEAWESNADLVYVPKSSVKGMAQNIDDFNAAVAEIMGRLYVAFPNRITLSANELAPLFPLEEGEPESVKYEKFERYHGLYMLYYHTALFLLEEGYIRGEQSGSYTVVNNCTLTTKGLMALERMPQALKKKRAIGEWLAEVAKDSAKDVPKELLRAVMRAFLGAE